MEVAHISTFRYRLRALEDLARSNHIEVMTALRVVVSATSCIGPDKSLVEDSLTITDALGESFRVPLEFCMSQTVRVFPQSDVPRMIELPVASLWFHRGFFPWTDRRGVYPSRLLSPNP
jgi:hypothetical protein